MFLRATFGVGVGVNVNLLDLRSLVATSPALWNASGLVCFFGVAGGWLLG